MAENDQILTMSLLLDGQYPAALSAADRWVAVSPARGLAHYVRGRCLVVLGRREEARDSFERAGSLQPRFLEAQVLRQELQRCLDTLHDASPPTREVLLAQCAAFDGWAT